MSTARLVRKSENEMKNAILEENYVHACGKQFPGAVGCIPERGRRGRIPAGSTGGARRRRIAKIMNKVLFFRWIGCR
jgi:hypothetical protein